MIPGQAGRRIFIQRNFLERESACLSLPMHVSWLNTVEAFFSKWLETMLRESA